MSGTADGASAPLAAAHLRHMEIGDLVIYRGRACYLRGFEPMSVPDRRVELEVAGSGEHLPAPLAHVEPGVDAPPASG